MLWRDLWPEPTCHAREGAVGPCERGFLADRPQNGDISVFGHRLQMRLKRNLSTGVDIIYDRGHVNRDVGGTLAVTKPGVGFADRLAYARWVRELSARGEETDAELAKNAGVGPKWL